MNPIIYTGDHHHAKVVCSAFAEGCKGKLAPAAFPIDTTRPAAMWGILRGAGDRIKECELYGVPYFYIDHGYFQRGHYDGHYRVVFCDRHLQIPRRGAITLCPLSKWEALGVELKPWRGETGGAVLYLPISRHVADYLGWDAEAYDELQLKRIKYIYRDQEIRVKHKSDGELTDHLDGVDVAVGFQSNALFDAAREGVRIVELGGGPGRMISNEASRDACIKWLADNQWTLQEMRSGKCWDDLMERYGDRMEVAA